MDTEKLFVVFGRCDVTSFRTLNLRITFRTHVGTTRRGWVMIWLKFLWMRELEKAKCISPLSIKVAPSSCLGRGGGFPEVEMTIKEKENASKRHDVKCGVNCLSSSRWKQISTFMSTRTCRASMSVLRPFRQSSLSFPKGWQQRVTELCTLVRYIVVR